MRKAIAALAVLMLALSFSTAQSLPEVAVGPDSDLYDAKTSVESVIEDLAPNETVKAQEKIKQAETRLAETENMVDQNNSELANQTASNYSDEIRELQDLGDQVSDMAQKRNISEMVANATYHHAEVLSRIHDKVPEQARKGIEKAMNSSVKSHQRAVQSLNETGGIPDGIGSQDIQSRVPESIRDSIGRPSGTSQPENSPTVQGGRP